MEAFEAREGSDQRPGQPGWLRTVREECAAIAAELGNLPLNVDMEFLAFLRVFSRFGAFRYGPLTIALGPVEDVFWREYEPTRQSGLLPWDALDRETPSNTQEHYNFFTRAWTVARGRGRRTIEDLDYLVAFMTERAGLPLRVFSELGISPEQVLAFAANERAGPTAAEERVERLYSPEEAAQYFGVRVETVRSWIRSGKLPAARLAGLKSIRIRESSLAAVLDPIAPHDPAAGTS